LFQTEDEYDECLTEASGSAGCDDDTVLFETDDDLADSVARVSFLLNIYTNDFNLFRSIDYVCE